LRSKLSTKPRGHILIQNQSALSPTPPFPKQRARLKLAGVLVPAIAISLLVTSSMFMKMITFGIGAGFFGDPIVMRGITLLNRKFPHWQKLLEIRKYAFPSFYPYLTCTLNSLLTISLVQFLKASPQTPN